MIDRDALAEAGWVLPKAPAALDEEGYEAWRPALNVYILLTGGQPASAPMLDTVDKKKVDMLREVLRAAPVEPRS